MCPSLSNTVSLLHPLCALYRELYVCDGGRSFSHPSPSDWQFNLIHRFHLLCFTSNNTDNTRRCSCAFTYMSVCACTCVCVCVRPLVSLKPHLWAFVLLWANPLVNLLSAMSRTVCSRELKGNEFGSLPLIFSLKTHFYNSLELVLSEMASSQNRFTGVSLSQGSFTVEQIKW